MVAEYVAKITGDTSGLDKALKKAGGSMRQLAENEVLIRLDYDGNIKQFNKVFDDIAHQHPELTIQFQYDINNKLLQSKLKELEKVRDFKLDIDTNKVQNKVDSLVFGIKNGFESAEDSEQDLLNKVKELYAYTNTAKKAGFQIDTSNFKVIDEVVAEFESIEKFVNSNRSKKIELFTIDKNINKTLQTVTEEVNDIQNAIKNLESKGASKRGTSEFDILQEEMKIIKVDLEELREQMNNLSGEAFQEMTNHVRDLEDALGDVLEKISKIKIPTSLKDIANFMSGGIGSKKSVTKPYWEKMIQDFDTLDEKTKTLLKDLGLLNSKGKLTAITDGANNFGGIIGEKNTAIVRNNTSLDNILKLKEALDSASESGVNCVQTLDAIQLGDKAVLELQTTIQGNQLAMAGNEKTNYLDIFDPSALNASDEQIQKLYNDAKKLWELGIAPELRNPSNLIFDEQNGFGFIDLDFIENTQSQFTTFEDMWKDFVENIKGTAQDFISEDNTSIGNAINQFALKIEQASTNYGKALTEGFRNGIDAHSNSKDGEDAADDFTNGVVDQTEANTPRLEKAATDAGNAYSDAFKKAINDIKSQANIGDINYYTKGFHEKVGQVTDSIVRMYDAGEAETYEYISAVQTLLLLLDEYIKKSNLAKNLSRSKKFKSFIETEQSVNGLDPKNDYTSKFARVGAIIEESFITKGVKKGQEINQVVRSIIEQYGELKHAVINADQEIETSSEHLQSETSDLGKEERERYKIAQELAQSVAEAYLLEEKSVESLTRAIMELLDLQLNVDDIFEELSKFKEIQDKVNSDDLRLFQDVRDYVSKSHIKITQGEKNEFPDEWQKVRNVIGAKVLTNSGGSDALAFLEELREAFGNIFGEANTTTEAITRLYEFLKNPPDVFEYLQDEAEQFDIMPFLEEAVDTAKSKLEALQQTSLLPGTQETTSQIDNLGQEFQESGEQGVTATEQMREGLASVTKEAEKAKEAINEVGNQTSANVISQLEKEAEARNKNTIAENNLVEAELKRQSIESNKNIVPQLEQEANAREENVKAENELINSEKQLTSTSTNFELLPEVIKQYTSELKLTIEQLREISKVAFQMDMGDKAFIPNNSFILIEQLSNDMDILSTKIVTAINNINTLITTVKSYKANNSSTPMLENGSVIDLDESQYNISDAEAKANAAEREAQAKKESAEAEKQQTQASEQGVLSEKEQAKTAKERAKEEKKALKDREKFNKLRASVLNKLGKLQNKGQINNVYGDEFKGMKQMIDDLSQSSPKAIQALEDIKNRLNEIEGSANSAGKAGKSMIQMLASKWKSLVAYLGSYASFYRIIGYVREAFTTLQTLDDELVDLRKTTKMTNTELEEFYHSSSDIAKQLGVTTSEIINQSSAWSRLGYNTKEAAITMSKLSSQFASISPGMDTETAQSGLVSIMKAFAINPEDVKKDIMDPINTLGNNFALSNADLVEGMSKSSAALSAVGTSFSDAAALFTGGMEILQDASSMGASLRTIAMRIRGRYSLPPYNESYMPCA